MAHNAGVFPTPLSADTSPDAERQQIEGWRRLSSVDRAALVTAMTSTVIELAAAGVRNRHPSDDEPTRRFRLAEVLHGPDLARRAFGHLIRTP